jgi:hypothetical protein
MHEEIKLPIQEVLLDTPYGWTIKEAIIKMALRHTGKKDWKGYDIEHPHIIARDGFIIVQVYKK